MTTILVTYASTHGHTGRIAARVADGLRARGAGVDLVPVLLDPDPRRYDAVVAGGSVHRGAHQPQLVAWLLAHRTALAGLPSALFSVSLTAAGDTDDARATTRRLIDELEEHADFWPEIAAAFAGALQYREYDAPTRVLMQAIAAQHGASTDTSRDVDLTDWDAVDRFAAEVATALAPARDRAGKMAA